MRKWAAAGVIAALLAAAFFLPERLSELNDAKLLNNPVFITHPEEREGFAESTQLTVAEKLLLIRGGTMDVMHLGTEEVAGIFVNISGSEEPETAGAADDLADTYEEELARKWEKRLEEVKREIRNLQAIGGLPELWDKDSDLSYAGYDELLYIDPGTRLNFQVYHMTLESAPYSMDVMADVQTSRIFSFSLRWDWEGRPNWGIRGASAFGAVWRNYWGMDSVGSGWYNESNRNILEHPGEHVKLNNDYSALGQVSFAYGGQSALIPLSCWVYGGRSCVVSWNM